MDNLKRKRIDIKITQYDLSIICNKFNLKNDENYFYKHALKNSWGCHQQLVDFITELIMKKPSIIEKQKKS